MTSQSLHLYSFNILCVPKKYKKQVKEERIKKLSEIEHKHEEKAKFIIHNYLSKLNNDKVWTISTRTDIPKQMNDWDCGVFMLEFIKYSILGKNFDFETSDMRFFRENIRDEIQHKQIYLENLNKEENTFYVSSSSSSEISVEDLTGNSNIESDTKSNSAQGNEQKPPRFQNECGTICWLNSLVQLLLITINEEDINSYLKSMFKNFNSGSQVKTTQGLRNYLSEYMQELENGQQDPFDFFVGLDLAPYTDKESILNPLSIFTKSVMTCSSDQRHSSSSYQPDPEFYVTINLPKDNETIADIIEREFQEGTLINSWRCSICSSHGGLKRKMIQEGLMPKFILVKVRRTERDEHGRTKKLNKEITPPLGFTITTEDNNVYAYSLCGVLTHIGHGMNSGHYIVDVRRDGQWWRCNDENIAKTSLEKLSRSGYGFLFEQM